MTTKLPSIPAFTGDNMAEVLSAISEALQVRTGQRGDTLDAGVTFRDLADLSLVTNTETNGGNSTTTTSAGNVKVIPITTGFDLYDGSKDLTTPPSPTDLKASDIFGTVLLSWNQAYVPNISFTEIYKSFSNDVTTAMLAGTASSQFFTDNPGPNRTIFYWVRVISQAAVKSPWNSTAGTAVTTTLDPAVIIPVLEGQILESSLSQSLASRISDAYDSAFGINGKVTTERNARIAAVLAEAQARATAITAEATARGAAITSEATIRQAADTSLATQITTFTAANAANAAAIQTETTARTNADNSLTQQITTQATTFNNTLANYTTTALLETNYYTKTGADIAIAAADTVLSTTFNNTLSGYTNTATLVNSYYTKTATDSAIAAADTALGTTFTNTLTGYTNTATLNLNYYTKTGADTAIATANTALGTTFTNTLSGYTNTTTLNLNYYTKTDADTAIALSATNLRAYSNINSKTFRQTSAPTQRGLDPQTSAVIPLATGDFWIDTDDANKPWQWNGTAWVNATDGAIAAVAASVTNVETSQIGYCTIGGVASDHTNKTTCLAASGTWNVGLPFASAVKQVSISDGSGSLSLEQRFTAQKNTNGTLNGQYTVKIDNNGHMAGFGLASTVVDGTPTSAFIIRSDKFAIVDPASSANSLTNTPSADTVPFLVDSGVVYMKSAFIKDASITSAKIGSLDARRIASGYSSATIGMSAAKMHGAELYAGGTTTITYSSETINGVVYQYPNGMTTSNPTFKVVGSDVEIVAANFKIKQLNTSATATTVFEVVNGEVQIANAFIGTGTITTAKIADTIQSTNYSAAAPFAGWQINKAGTAIFNEVTVRGQIAANSLLAGAQGSMPAVAAGATTMTGSGGVINSSGVFGLGNSTTNITFNGSEMRFNGNVVDIENLIPGAALPNYVRTYKGSVSPTVNIGTLVSNNAWGPLAMDAAALNNKLGATDYDAYRTLFPAGTYFYELSVPVKNNTSDTNDATYTALVVNPPGGVGGSYQNVVVGYDENGAIYNSVFVSNAYTVISTCGVNVVGDWQTATIFGVGRFILSSATYISPAVMTTESNSMNIVARTGYCTLIWRVWKAN